MQYRTGAFVLRLLAPGFARAGGGKQEVALDVSLHAHRQPVLEQFACPRRDGGFPRQRIAREEQQAELLRTKRPV